MTPKALWTVSKPRKKKEKKREREKSVEREAGYLGFSFQRWMHLKVTYTIQNDRA